MRSEVFAVDGEVRMRLAIDLYSGQRQECQFDSIEVAEELAYAILDACDAARGQKPLPLGTIPEGGSC